MFDRIRRRLTLGYVGILALILLLFGAIVVSGFFLIESRRQDEVLTDKANTKRDELLKTSTHSSEPRIPTSSDSNIAYSLMSVDKTASYGPEKNRSGASDPYLGLPYEESAMSAASSMVPKPKTLQGEGGSVRVVSVPVAKTQDGNVLVVQAAQPRGVVWDPVTALALVLAVVGLGALALAFVGGLFMSRRAMRPVQDSFDRQRTFIADASHELKTPLTLIRADAEVLQRGMTDPDQRELADDLLSETDRMNTVLSDLLLLTRLDAGKLSVEQETFDLSQVIIQAAERFRARAAAEGINIETELSGKLLVLGDEERTGQILAALLDNADRFTPENGSITISGKQEDRGIKASVTDTGPGIASEHLPRLFDRFYRAEASRTRSDGGTGLGLAIARDLARVQGGALEASNAENGGAVFTLRLPSG